MGQNTKPKIARVSKRLGVLIIPAGLLAIILLSFYVLFPDSWYVVFWEYIKKVMQHGGFLIIMLVNILWISNAFININDFVSGSLEKRKLNGNTNSFVDIKRPLLYPITKKIEINDYSFLFYELTVRFLVLVGLEISICYVFFFNRLSDVLALTLPMVTVFIVCSCFIVSRNDKRIFEIEQNKVADNVGKIIQKLQYPFRICNRENGKFFVSPKAKRIMNGSSIVADLVRLEVQYAYGEIELLSTSKNEEEYEIFLVSKEQLNIWKKIKDNDEIQMFLVYAYHSILHDKESEVTLVVNLSLSDNQFKVL